MSSLSMAGVVAAVVMVAAPLEVQAQEKPEVRLENREENSHTLRAEVVDSRIVWNKAPYSGLTDLIRFRDQWYLAFMEGTEARTNDGVIRILTSADGAQWESTARLESPTPGRSVSNPKLTTTPDGNLMVAAVGIVPHPTNDSPLPQWGGTLQELGWLSADGRRWDAPHRIGPHDWSHGRIAWLGTTAYVYSHGTICGIMHVLQISSRPDGGAFEVLHEATPGHFPDDAALLLSGNSGYCLASQIGEGNQWDRGLLGIAPAPFRDWTWKLISDPISHPNLLRLDDGTLLAAARFHRDKPETAICELDPTTGALLRLATLPANALSGNVGIAWHDGFVWVSYRADDRGKSSIAIAKVRVTRLP